MNQRVEDVALVAKYSRFEVITTAMPNGKRYQHDRFPFVFTVTHARDRPRNRANNPILTTTMSDEAYRVDRFECSCTLRYP